LPLKFHPGPGAIVICDYSTGFQPPEMVKVRPVVVISPRRRTGGIVTVVPISSVSPTPIEPWHYRLPLGVYPPARGEVWIKGDMVAAVALSRLDRVRARDARGNRIYETYQLSAADLAAVYAAVKAALGLP
jgi:uncharacterized protein YifN (PemK superfamily)